MLCTYVHVYYVRTYHGTTRVYVRTIYGTCDNTNTSRYVRTYSSTIPGGMGRIRVVTRTFGSASNDVTRSVLNRPFFSNGNRCLLPVSSYHYVVASYVMLPSASLCVCSFFVFSFAALVRVFIFIRMPTHTHIPTNPSQTNTPKPQPHRPALLRVAGPSYAILIGGRRASQPQRGLEVHDHSLAASATQRRSILFSRSDDLVAVSVALAGVRAATWMTLHIRPPSWRLRAQALAPKCFRGQAPLHRGLFLTVLLPARQ
jgi:hypothetical protein